MAVPKCKVSKARRDKRRGSNWKLSAPGVVACPKEPVRLVAITMAVRLSLWSLSKRRKKARGRCFCLPLFSLPFPGLCSIFLPSFQKLPAFCLTKRELCEII